METGVTSGVKFTFGFWVLVNEGVLYRSKNRNHLANCHSKCQIIEPISLLLL